MAGTGNRLKFFEIDDRSFRFYFGTWTLMLYYAKGLNEVKAKYFYDLCLSEYWYLSYENEQREKLKLPLWDTSHLRADYDNYIVFDTYKILTTIGFIDEIIESLNKEPVELLEKYGGMETFLNTFYDNNGFLEMSPDSDEYYDDNYGIAHLLTIFKEKILKYSLEKNKPYKVYID